MDVDSKMNKGKGPLMSHEMLETKATKTMRRPPNRPINIQIEALETRLEPTIEGGIDCMCEEAVHL